MAPTQGRVSSGLRVEAASDNAAYWAISTTMKSDNKALSAVADALGLGAAKVDVAYSGMDAVIDVLSEFKAKLVADPIADVDDLISAVDVMTEAVVSGPSVLGALQSRIDIQSDFTAELMDTIDKGIGAWSTPT